MKTLSSIILCFLCITVWGTAHAARDVQAELKQLKQQRQMIAQVQKKLNADLGSVGKDLKKLDIELLAARNAYRQVREDINTVDTRIEALVKEKNQFKADIQSLYDQMKSEASAAYQNKGTDSVWVDVLNDVSITEIPHRKYLIKLVMQAQEKDREQWRQAMEKLALLEQEELNSREKLVALKLERKAAEDSLVGHIHTKREAAKKLHADIQAQQQQEIRLAKQEKALQRLLEGMGDTLLSADKQSQSTPIRKLKGKLAWPMDGHVMVGFGKTTHTGIKLAGVHISPKKRTETGKQVLAASQGQVRYADWFGGYGLMMIVDYGQGVMAVYAHNDALHKQLGDWVEKNEVLAEAGSTGWIEDIRLYFEIRDKGKAVNPTQWCKN